MKQLREYKDEANSEEQGLIWLKNIIVRFWNTPYTPQRVVEGRYLYRKNLNKAVENGNLQMVMHAVLALICYSKENDDCETLVECFVKETDNLYPHIEKTMDNDKMKYGSRFYKKHI